MGYYPLAARASARPLRGSPRVSASTERRALTRTPPRSPLDSSTRAVKALGSKSVAGLPVMARCVRAPIPPHVLVVTDAERLSRRENSNLRSPPPLPPASGSLADDTPPPTQRTTAPPSSSPAPAARPPPPPPRSPSRSSRRLAPRLPRLPSPASPSPSSASPSASCCCAWRPPSRARSKRFPSLATPRVPDRRTRVIVKCRKRIVSSGSRWRRVIISKLRARVPRNVFGAH